MDDWAVAAGEPAGAVTGRLGSITLYELADPVAVLAIAAGAISFRMIRAEVELVTEFARAHGDGWCYLADVRRVRFLNPVNLVALRRIERLPGSRRRTIVAPKAARWLQTIAIGDLVTSPAEALERSRHV